MLEIDYLKYNYIVKGSHGQVVLNRHHQLLFGSFDVVGLSNGVKWLEHSKIKKLNENETHVKSNYSGIFRGDFSKGCTPYIFIELSPHCHNNNGM